MAQFAIGGHIFGRQPVIKSIQYNTVSHVDTVNTRTITAVNVDNSIIMNLGVSQTGGGDGEADDYFAYVELTDSTTVTATKQDADLDSNSILSFCVIEFFPGIIKSVQAGTIAITSGNTSNTDTITSVDTSKSMLIHLGTSTTGGFTAMDDIEHILTRITLTNATTITATRHDGTSASSITSYMLAEFF